MKKKLKVNSQDSQTHTVIRIKSQDVTSTIFGGANTLSVSGKDSNWLVVFRGQPMWKNMSQIENLPQFSGWK